MSNGGKQGEWMNSMQPSWKEEQTKGPRDPKSIFEVMTSAIGLNRGQIQQGAREVHNKADLTEL